MPDEHMNVFVPEFRLDLAIWSLVVFLVVLVVAVNWYRNMPTIPIVILSVTVVLGLLVWPVLAIVSAVLLAGLVVSTVLRPPSSA